MDLCGVPGARADATYYERFSLERGIRFWKQGSFGERMVE
jgi:hypothetical protein